MEIPRQHYTEEFKHEAVKLVIESGLSIVFEKLTPKQTVRQSYNLRLWKTNLETVYGKHAYVGSVSMDSEMKWGLTHKIKPVIDSE